jgi:YfiH family protein
VTVLSPVLGVPGVRVAVSARNDGNMGFTGARDPKAVRDARRRFLADAGMDAGAAAAVRQVHGARILRVGARERGRGGLDPAAVLGDADGLVTADPGVPLLALSADCCVVALAADRGRGAAVFHAGWRGALAGTPAAAVQALSAESGAPPSTFRAVLGPAIGPCCYEVGEDVVIAFQKGFGEDASRWIRPGPGPRPHLDVPAAVRQALVSAGLRPGSIGPAGPCTLCGGPWFSHRRGDAGRQMVAVMIEG